MALGGATAERLYQATQQDWTEEHTMQLRSLSLSSLPPLPPDPSNRVADDPRAAELGKAIFFDTRFSANGKVACATCHLPARAGPVDDPAAAAAWAAPTADQRTGVTAVYANMGKAIVAFERTIAPTPTRYDAWVASPEFPQAGILSQAEIDACACSSARTNASIATMARF